MFVRSGKMSGHEDFEEMNCWLKAASQIIEQQRNILLRITREEAFYEFLHLQHLQTQSARKEIYYKKLCQLDLDKNNFVKKQRQE